MSDTYCCWRHGGRCDIVCVGDPRDPEGAVVTPLFKKGPLEGLRGDVALLVSAGGTCPVYHIPDPYPLPMISPRDLYVAHGACRPGNPGCSQRW
eukprot:1181931-Prorocentrum_minimum.AAC.3